jgi:hypothetical protein
MSRKRTSARVAGVQMQLEPLDGRVLPDAKMDWDVSGPAATVQPTDVDSKPDHHKSEDHHKWASESAHSGANLAKIWEHLLRGSHKHSADYQAMLQNIDTDNISAFAHQLVVLDSGAVNVSVTNYIAETEARSEKPPNAEMGKIEEATSELIETIRTEESEGEKVLASTKESVSAASLTAARIATEGKPALAEPRHATSELNIAYLGAASEFQSNPTARLEGDHAVALLTPNRVDDPPNMLPVTKGLLVVPPNHSPLGSTALPENSLVAPASPLVVSVADIEETETASQAQTEEAPGFASQAADLVSRYTPFDSATVNETIDRFLNSLRDSRLPKSAWSNVWNVVLISTAVAMGALSAEFIRRKRLLARVPMIRNLSQRLTRTKIA